MKTPLTSIDSRFSEPDASPTTWDEAQQALSEAELFWLTTVRADGRPHMTPLVAIWLDDAVYFGTGGDEQKAHNLHANSRVILTTGCNQWDRGLDVVVEGTAARVTDEALLKRLVGAWATKWDGRWQYEVKDGKLTDVGGGGEEGGVLVFGVTPDKVLAFGKGNFTQTRHRFDRKP